MSEHECKFEHLKIGERIEIGVFEEWILFMSRDARGFYILGSGECALDVYRPKYCPECGRKLNDT